MNVCVQRSLRRGALLIIILAPFMLWAGRSSAESSAIKTSGDLASYPSRSRQSYNFENHPVWRVQVGITTYTSPSNAGTQDDVRIRLNGNNSTWLDSPIDDFERGDDRMYDLNLQGITKISDIQFFEIYKTGSDGWNVRRVRLYVNNAQMIYDWSAPPPTYAVWFDGAEANRTLLITSTAGQRGAPPLRNNPHYLARKSEYASQGPTGSFAPPASFSSTELRRRMEGWIGHSMRGSSYFWGTGGLTISRIAARQYLVIASIREDVQWDVDRAYMLQLFIDVVPSSNHIRLRIANALLQQSGSIVVSPAINFFITTRFGVLAYLLNLGAPFATSIIGCSINSDTSLTLQRS